MISSQQMAKREEIASNVLGTAVRHGDTMRCLFEDLHSHSSGPRDVRICLEEKGDFLPTFMCFHSSCKESWAPLNKELRRRIWFAEHGMDPDKRSAWSGGGVKPEPKEEHETVVFEYATLAAHERRDWRVDAEWLRLRSPIDPTTCTPASYLDAVFQPGQFIMIFTKFLSQGQFMYVVGSGKFYRLAPRPKIKAVPSALPTGGPDGMWYLCSPVDGQWHPNPRAPLVHGQVKESRRAEESVTSFPYIVLECDHKERACPCKVCKGKDNPRVSEMWLNFLVQLPLPIAAIYTSGGKSVHALVKVDASSKVNWERWKTLVKELTVKCGADLGAMSAVRLTRLPGCLRGDKMQRLLYLNPEPDPGGEPVGMGGVLRV